MPEARLLSVARVLGAVAGFVAQVAYAATVRALSSARVQLTVAALLGATVAFLPGSTLTVAGVPAPASTDLGR